jgi:hypothetical protein
MKLTKKQIEVREKKDDLVAKVEAMTVTDEASAEAMAAVMKIAKELKTEAEKLFGPIKTKARSAWQAAVDAEKSVVQPLIDTIGVGKRKVAKWADEETRKARIEQLRLETEARKEATAQVEAEAAAVETVDPATARAIRSTIPAIQSSTMPTVSAPKPSLPNGVSSRQLPQAKVYDPVALILWIAQAPDDRLVYVTFNHAALIDKCRSSGGAAEVPGVEFWFETNIAMR